MEDWKHRAVSHRIDEVDRLPAAFQWAGFGLPIPDDAGDDQVWIVESRAKGMHKRVAEFSALVHGVRDVRSAVTRHPAWRREFAKHKPHSVLIRRDLRMNFGI